ncbi:MAG: alkaline phosphatase D family protein [Pirellulaceae bacterium]|nr:alkaline phosphatase D family protein [Pirellulaceae bacterium]
MSYRKHCLIGHLLTFLLICIPLVCQGQETSEQDRVNPSPVVFSSQDGLPITADLYRTDRSQKNATLANCPLIVLCHQAGWSRGEYRKIAPRLNQLGFDCLAIDQRSGKETDGVVNETALRAAEKNLSTEFLAAEQDILATLAHVRSGGMARGKVILWGSSYSASLALKIAGDQPDLVDGVLAFSPGEYFVRLGKPKDWIAESAKKINVPTFVTSSSDGNRNREALLKAIPETYRQAFIPDGQSQHGSSALWDQFAGNGPYWEATEKFLTAFQPSRSTQVLGTSDIQSLPSRIAFGSCGHQDKPQPILNTIVRAEPDLFIYLGDNIYGDTKDMSVLKAKYETLGNKPEFRQLRSSVPVLSVWDDHDYGWNDAGKEYEFKQESKEIFMDFWRVPADSARRQHTGIYGAHPFSGVTAKKTGDAVSSPVLQIILLDTRTFRDPLSFNPKPLPEGSKLKNAYQPDPDPGKTLLGESQWEWLETELRKPADVRIICSSIQFGHEYNGWESWTNLPAEQARMAKLIRDTRAAGVVFISGDVHWGEISRRSFEGLYPIYDVTASGLTEEWYNVEPNRLRVGEAYRDNHFGMIEIDWSQEDPLIVLQIIDTSGETRNRHEVRLSELQISR